jgi:hypothetical protein
LCISCCCLSAHYSPWFHHPKEYTVFIVIFLLLISNSHLIDLFSEIFSYCCCVGWETRFQIHTEPHTIYNSLCFNL